MSRLFGLLLDGRVLDTELFQVGLVFRRIEVEFLQLRRELLHFLFVQINRRLIVRANQRLIFDLFGLDVIEVVPRLFDEVRLQ